ncbi:MAG: tetratricopeptide repeat protein [Planctomycetota bacterium]
MATRGGRTLLPTPPRTAPAVTMVCLATVVLATALSFVPALHNEFLYWDDENNLMFNTHIRGFSTENLKWMWTSSLLGVWQPLTWMIATVEYKLLDGADLVKFSRGMHLASIVLHSVAAIFVYFVVRRLIALGVPETAARSPLGLGLGAAVGALLFAVHPLRCEIVAWASGQPYILALIPALAAVWCYLRAQQTGRWYWHGAALGCLAVSLLCKATAVPLVAVLLVLDYYPLRRFGGAAGWNFGMLLRVLLEKVPYAALTLVAVGLTVWATWATKTYKPEPVSTKLLVAAFCMLFYVSMTFVPFRLAPYYMRPTPFDSSDPWFGGAALAFVAVTVVFVLIRRRRSWLLATWGAYVLVLLPVVGLVKHGGQMAADRYSYLSCIGWAALVGAAMLRTWAGAASPARTARRVVSLAVAGGLVVGLAIMSRSYSRVWKDSVSIWSAMVQRNPKFWMGYYNLAKAYKRPGDELWQQAGQKARTGDPQAAEALYREAAPWLGLAEANYRKAIELYPTYPEANVDLGNMIKDGKVPGGAATAMKHYETALQGQPSFHMAHFNLGVLLMQLERYDEAVKHLELAEADAERAGEKKRLPAIRSALESARKKANRP